MFELVKFRLVPIRCFILVSLVSLGSNPIRGDEATLSSDLESQISALDGATEVNLMIVPYGVSFRYDLDPERLPGVTCVYGIFDDNRSGIMKVISILKTAIVDNNGKSGPIDAHIGIVFKQGGAVIGEAYFSGTAGDAGVPGRFNRKPVWMRRSAEHLIRALPVDTKAVRMSCPQ